MSAHADEPVYVCPYLCSAAVYADPGDCYVCRKPLAPQSEIGGPRYAAVVAAMERGQVPRIIVDLPRGPSELLSVAADLRELAYALDVRAAAMRAKSAS